MNEEYDVTEMDEMTEYEGEKDYSGLVGAGVLMAGGALAYKGGEVLVKKVVIPVGKKLKPHIPFLNKKEPEVEAVVEEVVAEEEK